MNNPNTNLENTQEIQIPKKYGDSFEQEYFTTYEENGLNKNKIDTLQVILFSLILTLCVITMCIILFKIIVPSPSAQRFKNVIPSSDVSKPKYQIKPSEKNNIDIPTEYYQNIFTEVQTEHQTEFAPTEEITTTISTEPYTYLNEEASNIIATAPIDYTNPTEPTSISIQKIISVSDISVTKSDANIFTAMVSGEFLGYSEKELLPIISVNTTSGKPKISLPCFSDSNSFTFTLNLEGCDGELHIHIDNYDFYQNISSFPD